MEMHNMPDLSRYTKDELIELCKAIAFHASPLRADQTIRYCLIEIDHKRNLKKIDEADKHAKAADQVTFRFLYADGEGEQAEWVKRNKWSTEREQALTEHVKKNGRALEILPFGRVKYSYDGMGIVLDNDCMATELSSDYKYLILRENCKLYSKWDDPSSLIF